MNTIETKKMTAVQRSTSNTGEKIEKDWRDYSATDLCLPENDRERILRWNPPTASQTLRPLPTRTGNEELIKEGIRKWITVTGNGAIPEYGNYCYIKYTAWFADSGVEFDSTTIRGNKPWMFPLGKGLGLIPGWDVTVATMKQGEIAVFAIPPEQGYMSGWPPKVPGNKHLVYEIELTRFEAEDCSTERNRSITRTYVKNPDESLQENKWDTPNDGAKVTAAVKVTANKKVIMEYDCLEWTCSEGCLIGLPAGVDVALKRMKKGERSVFRLAPEYGFTSEQKVESFIDQNDVIEVDIELKDYRNAHATWKLSDDDYLSNCETLIENGVKLIEKGFPVEAYKKLRRAEGLLRWRKRGQSTTDDQSDDAVERRRVRRNQLYLATCLHLAMACLDLEKPEEACELSERVLNEEPGNATALYRRAMARKLLGDCEAAAADLQRVVQTEPSNKAAQQELLAVRKVSNTVAKKISMEYTGDKMF